MAPVVKHTIELTALDIINMLAGFANVPADAIMYVGEGDIDALRHEIDADNPIIITWSTGSYTHPEE